jgi:putative sugar-specific permease sgaT/ulaA
MGLVLGNAYEWVGMAGIYGIVAIAALVLIIPNFIKTKGKVINYVEED